MPSICAILPHRPGDTRTLTCLDRLLSQSRQPDHIVLINRDRAEAPEIEQAVRMVRQRRALDKLHLIPSSQEAIPSETDTGRGFSFAFHELGADYVWVLESGMEPRPDCLETLLTEETGGQSIRISLITHPSDPESLGRPLALPAPGKEKSLDAWKPVLKKKDLPDKRLVPCRGNLTAALYPRAVWEKTGSPTLELFLNGEDEEYPWRARQAGFRFVTVTASVQEQHRRTTSLLHTTVAGHPYFYEVGLSIPLMYNKLRNWAWLERSKHPRAHLQRLARCGGYILFTINAIIQTGDLSIPRLYNVFRALHNGFYGKLRPY